MKRTTLLLTVFTVAMVMALLMVAMAVPVFAGGGDDDEDNDNESANGGATRNGQSSFAATSILIRPRVPSSQ